MSQYHAIIFSALRRFIFPYKHNEIWSLRISGYCGNLVRELSNHSRYNLSTIPNIRNIINELGFFKARGCSGRYNLKNYSFDIDMYHYEGDILPHIISGNCKNFDAAVQSVHAARSGCPIRRLTPSTSQHPTPYQQPATQESFPTLRAPLENTPSPPDTSGLNTRQRSLSPRSPVYTPGPVYTPVPENISRPHGPKPPAPPRTPVPLTPPQSSWSPAETDQALEDAIAVMRDSPRGRDGQS